MKGLRMIFTVVSFTLNATFKLTRRNHRVTFDDHFRRTISHKRDTIVSWVIWDFLKFFFTFFLFCFAKSFSSFFTISHTRFSYASKIKPCVLSSVNVKRWGLYYKAYWFGFVRQAAVTLHENDPWQNTISLTYQIKYLLRKKKIMNIILLD